MDEFLQITIDEVALEGRNGEVFGIAFTQPVSNNP